MKSLMPAGADTSICAWSAGSAKHAGRHPLATAEAGVDAGRRATIQTIDNDVGRTSDLWPPQQHPVVAGYTRGGIEKHAMYAAAHCLQTAALRDWRARIRSNAPSTRTPGASLVSTMLGPLSESAPSAAGLTPSRNSGVSNRSRCARPVCLKCRRPRVSGQ